jgi:sugar-specific transcriptional regulator TrmB
MWVVLGLESDIFEKFRGFGLTAKQSRVYVHLARRGASRASDLSFSLKVDRTEVYRILRVLQRRGLVKSTFERPARFEATPIGTVLEMFIDEKKREVVALEKEKEELIKQFEVIEAMRAEEGKGGFAVLEGRVSIYSRMSQMIREAEKEVIVITTSLGVTRGELAGFLDLNSKKNVKGRALAKITPENIGTIKKAMASFPFEARHVELDYHPRIMISDDREAIIFITSREDTSLTSSEDTGLWTNSPPFVKTLKSLFENLWNCAEDSKVRISEIESEKPT